MNLERPSFEEMLLAALLHDIGKFKERAYGDSSPYTELKKIFCPYIEKRENYGFIHSVYTYDFIVNDIIIPDLHNLKKDLIARLAAAHHKPLTIYEKIIGLADELSSGIDRRSIDEESGTRTSPKTALNAIYDEIFTDISKSPPTHYYPLKPLRCGDELIPEKNNPISHIKQDYHTHWEDFFESLKKLNKHDKFSQYLSDLISILEKYTWCIPSATGKAVPDVSLYDHLITTAAITTVIYNYYIKHPNSNNIFSKSKKSDCIFLLFHGQISGIQDFIFGYKSGGTTGLSSVLRARSFYISALTDMISLYVLHKFGYSALNKIIDAGGYFLLLLDEDENNITRNIIHGICNEFNIWLKERYNCELVLNYSFLSINCNSLLNKEEQHGIGNILNQLSLNMRAVKQNKHIFTLTNNNKWDQNNFIIEKKYEDEQILCNLCGKEAINKKEQKCLLCKKQEELGRELINSKYYSIFFNGLGKYSAINNEISFSLSNELKENADITWHIGKNPEEFASRKWVSNYIPVDENTRQPLTFEKMAQNADGAKYLAVLKADMDDLGIILHRGFAKRYISLSRIASFSRMTDLFFKGYLQSLIKENNNNKSFSNTYTIFAGGDDLLLIGPWDELISFSVEMYGKFKKYTCNNSLVNISAGIDLFPVKVSVAFAVENADNLLTISKYDKTIKNSLNKDWYLGKNRLTLFETTVNWEYIDKLMDFGYFLDSCIKKHKAGKKSSISKIFIHKLLRYQMLYNKSKSNTEDLNAYLWKAYLLYDINRNIILSDDSNDKIHRVNMLGNDSEVLLSYLLPNGTSKLITMEYLKIPAFWAILKNRDDVNI